MVAPFNWELPYRWPRTPVLARNVVCTSQPLAAQAGLAMLAAGGNAVDAAIATAITLTVVEPTMNGIGSDAFAIVWDGRQLHGLNASGRSPAAWTPEYFGDAGVQPQGHVQVVSRIVDHGQNPQAACDSPRFRWCRGLDVNCEPGFPDATLDELRRRGHRLTVVHDYAEFGSCQAIWRLDDTYLAVSDPRRDGQAAGF